jgi:hypothetical protein
LFQKLRDQSPWQGGNLDWATAAKGSNAAHKSLYKKCILGSLWPNRPGDNVTKKYCAEGADGHLGKGCKTPSPRSDVAIGEPPIYRRFLDCHASVIARREATWQSQ